MREGEGDGRECIGQDVRTEEGEGRQVFAALSKLNAVHRPLSNAVDADTDFPGYSCVDNPRLRCTVSQCSLARHACHVSGKVLSNMDYPRRPSHVAGHVRRSGVA